MPTCSRCGLAALVLLALAFTGCDTNNGGSGALGDLEGVYALAELRFDPNTTALPDADIAARYDLDNTTLEIFGEDNEALLRSQRLGGGSRRTDLEVRVFSNSVEFTALTADDEEDLAELFLPRQFRLAFSSPAESATELRAEPDLFLSNVNLEAFNPDLYEDQVSVNGRLAVSFRRP